MDRLCTKKLSIISLSPLQNEPSGQHLLRSKILQTLFSSSSAFSRRGLEFFMFNLHRITLLRNDQIYEEQVI